MTDFIISKEFANCVQLIASDLDGTLMTSYDAMTPRVAAAIEAAHEAGIKILAATGRQAVHLPKVINEVSIDYAVPSNGSIGYNLTTKQVLFSEYLEPQVIAKIVDFLNDAFPGVTFGSVVEEGSRMLVEPLYNEISINQDFYLRTSWFQLAEIAEIMSNPSIKLIARHPSVTEEELYQALEASDIDGFHATTSGAPFVEVSTAGVNKATGLAKICKILGIPRSSVVTIGDARNDIEMIQWSPFGVAMGNAIGEVKAAADAVTAPVEEDGLAVLIEKILATRD